MNRSLKHTCMIVRTVVLSTFAFVSIAVITPTTVGAAEPAGFGEKKGIATAEEALKALKKHFEKRDLVIGEITEKELYFEAEIKDRKNAIIDKVVVDKRTGRIRSIY